MGETLKKGWRGGDNTQLRELRHSLSLFIFSEVQASGLGAPPLCVLFCRLKRQWGGYGAMVMGIYVCKERKNSTDSLIAAFVVFNRKG